MELQGPEVDLIANRTMHHLYTISYVGVSRSSRQRAKMGVAGQVKEQRQIHSCGFSNKQITTTEQYTFSSDPTHTEVFVHYHSVPYHLS